MINYNYLIGVYSGIGIVIYIYYLVMNHEVHEGCRGLNRLGFIIVTIVLWPIYWYPLHCYQKEWKRTPIWVKNIWIYL